MRTGSSPRADSGAAKLTLAILLLTTVSGLVSSDILFDKVKPVIWLKHNSLVNLGVMEYNINFAYQSPCHLFEKHIRANLRPNTNLTTDDQVKLEAFNKSCTALYIIEWAHEVEQLLTKINTSRLDHQYQELPRAPYRESTGRFKREIDLALLTNGTDPAGKEALTWTQIATYIFTGPAGALLFQPKSPYTEALARRAAELQHLKEQVDNSTTLDLFITRIKQQQKFQKRSIVQTYKEVVLPPDWKWYEIAGGVLCPFCWPWLRNHALQRTYEEKVSQLEEEIKSKIYNATLDRLLNAVAETGGLDRPFQSRPKRGVILPSDSAISLVTNPGWYDNVPAALDALDPNFHNRLLLQIDILRSALTYLGNATLSSLKGIINVPREISKRDTSRIEEQDEVKIELTWWETFSCFFTPFACSFYREAAQKRALLKEIERLKGELKKKISDTSLDTFLDNVATTGKINGAVNLPPPLPVAVPKERTKRGISEFLQRALSESITQTVGVFTGNVVSNLVQFAFEQFYPNSNTNRIRRLEEAYEDFKNNFEIGKQFNRGVLDHLDKLSNIAQETLARISQHIQSFPQYTWISSLVVQKISQSGLDLQRVTDEAVRGMIAIEPFVRLTGISALRGVDSANTKLISIQRINDHTLNFKFLVMIESVDTRVYQVRAFDHWDNLDERPRLLHYTGAKYLIYNETANCIKSLGYEAPPAYISDQCIELDGEDPELNQWTSTEVTDEIEKFSHRSDVHKTAYFNYIYCFPGNITINGREYRCPMDVFRLKFNLEWKTAQQRHKPAFIAVNTTLRQEAFDTVHAGHFPDDSDTVQHLALFERLREERRNLTSLTESMKNSFSVSKSNPWFWTLVASILASWVATSVYLVTVLWARASNLPTGGTQAPPYFSHKPGTLRQTPSSEYIPMGRTSGY